MYNLRLKFKLKMYCQLSSSKWKMLPIWGLFIFVLLKSITSKSTLWAFVPSSYLFSIVEYMPSNYIYSWGNNQILYNLKKKTIITGNRTCFKLVCSHFSARRQVNKRSGQWFRVELRVAKTYPYISELQTMMIDARLKDDLPIARPAEMEETDPRRLAPNIAANPPPPVSLLVEEHKSRFDSKKFKKLWNWNMYKLWSVPLSVLLWKEFENNHKHNSLYVKMAKEQCDITTFKWTAECVQVSVYYLPHASDL